MKSDDANLSGVELTQIDLCLERLPRSFDGFRLAHLSDVHIEGGAMRRQFPQLARFVSAQRPDLIALTGDYITHKGNWQEEPLFEGFRQLEARDGVFAVMGNHDHFGHIEQPRRALKRAGIRELRNEATHIERTGESLWIAGVDDWLTRHADLNPIIQQIPAGAGAILLAHMPDFADKAAPCHRFDLMLSGHSHGGQIALPFGRPYLVPPGSFKYPRGLYCIGDMQLYTSRGLGTVHIPLRINARPEITVFTLRCA